MTDNTMIAKADVRTALQDALEAVQPKLKAMHDAIDAVIARGDSPAGDAVLDTANDAHAELNTQFQGGMAMVADLGGPQTNDDGEKPPPHP